MDESGERMKRIATFRFKSEVELDNRVAPPRVIV
jgi:hypothetical protein